MFFLISKFIRQLDIVCKNFEHPEALIKILTHIRAKIDQYQDPPQEELRLVDLKIKSNFK
jgi:hypothetical protein